MVFGDGTLGLRHVSETHFLVEAQKNASMMRMGIFYIFRMCSYSLALYDLASLYKIQLQPTSCGTGGYEEGSRGVFDS